MINAIQIAKVLHEAIRIFPRADGSELDLWENLSEPEKYRAVSAVKTIMESSMQTAEEYHDLWMKPLLEDGWALGPYDANRKTHPSLLPFEELSEMEKAKDKIWMELTSLYKPFYFNIF